MRRHHSNASSTRSVAASMAGTPQQADYLSAKLSGRWHSCACTPSMGGLSNNVLSWNHSHWTMRHPLRDPAAIEERHPLRDSRLEVRRLAHEAEGTIRVRRTPGGMTAALGWGPASAAAPAQQATNRFSRPIQDKPPAHRLHASIAQW